MTLIFLLIYCLQERKQKIRTMFHSWQQFTVRIRGDLSQHSTISNHARKLNFGLLCTNSVMDLSIYMHNTHTHLHIYTHTYNLPPDVTAAIEIVRSCSILANWYGSTLTWADKPQGFPDSLINISLWPLQEQI